MYITDQYTMTIMNTDMGLSQNETEPRDTPWKSMAVIFNNHDGKRCISK